VGCVKTQEVGSSQRQATFMHRVSVIVHCIIIIVSKDHNKNRALLCYLFQENKSFGSKTLLAFILWCTGSCVEHSYCRSYGLNQIVWGHVWKVGKNWQSPKICRTLIPGRSKYGRHYETRCTLTKENRDSLYRKFFFCKSECDTHNLKRADRVKTMYVQKIFSVDQNVTHTI
jgi:hypothetical protein